VTHIVRLIPALFVRRFVFACIASLFAVAAPAQSLTFAHAKKLADDAEATLSLEEKKELIAAQAVLATAAFPACLSRSGPPPARFTVIVQVAANGKVEKSWLDDQSAFVSCFRDAMMAGFLYRPPAVPFFTSFSYTR
jgi:hypothetical protein